MVSIQWKPFFFWDHLNLGRKMVSILVKTNQNLGQDLFILLLASKRALQCKFLATLLPTAQAKEFLSTVLDMANNLSPPDNTIRDDQAPVLVLACATFGTMPPKQQGKSNMAKYLYFTQDTGGHARWLTTPSGYLRIKLFHIGNLKTNQLAELNNIIQFIVDVYAPSFFQIYLHPSAVQGPSVVLKMRNFMKACRVSGPAKEMLHQPQREVA